jgi:hypothetical protein
MLNKLKIENLYEKTVLNFNKKKNHNYNSLGLLAPNMEAKLVD